MRSEVLGSIHNSLLGRHLGQKKTKRKLQQRFYWFQMRGDVNIWIEKCDVCARMKHSSQRPRAALGDMRNGAPLDRLSIDLVGPLPETVHGNQHILVLTDHFRKWAEAYPVPSTQYRTRRQRHVQTQYVESSLQNLDAPCLSIQIIALNRNYSRKFVIS